MRFLWSFLLDFPIVVNDYSILGICLFFVDRNGLTVDLQSIVHKAVEEGMNKLRAGFARDVATETKASIVR